MRPLTVPSRFSFVIGIALIVTLVSAPTFAGRDEGVAPRVKRKVAPAFPAEAAEAGVGGSVTAELVVRRDGSVDRVRILESSTPDMGFEQVTLEALEQWRFKPARVGRKRVEGRMLVRLDYSPPERSLARSGRPISPLLSRKEQLPNGVRSCWTTAYGPLPCQSWASLLEARTVESLPLLPIDGRAEKRAEEERGEDEGVQPFPDTLGQMYRRPSPSQTQVTMPTHVTKSSKPGTPSRLVTTSRSSQLGTRSTISRPSTTRGSRRPGVRSTPSRSGASSRGSKRTSRKTNQRR